MKNQLAVIVKDSKLEPTKAKFILKKFQDYFEIASEWEKKAKTIVVTKATQIDDMEKARVGRLFLKEKRVAVEKSRKELKEQAIREGKAIDGIANVLKALIVPIEEYLDRQEHFVEIQRKKKEEAKRIAEEKRIEEERIAEEKKKEKEQKKVRLENALLKREAEERDKKMAAERKRQQKKLADERAKADAERKVIEDKARKERDAIEAKARKEREAQEKKLADEKAKAEAEKKDAAEKARIEKEKERIKAEAERKEKERLAELLKNKVKCPECGHEFQREEKS